MISGSDGLQKIFIQILKIILLFKLMVSPINLITQIECLWILGVSWSTQKEPTQT